MSVYFKMKRTIWLEKHAKENKYSLFPIIESGAP
jgi:hypothetical protein